MNEAPPERQRPTPRVPTFKKPTTTTTTTTTEAPEVEYEYYYDYEYVDEPEDQAPASSSTTTTTTTAASAPASRSRSRPRTPSRPADAEAQASIAAEATVLEEPVRSRSPPSSSRLQATESSRNHPVFDKLIELPIENPQQPSRRRDSLRPTALAAEEQPPAPAPSPRRPQPQASRRQDVAQPTRAAPLEEARPSLEVSQRPLKIQFPRRTSASPESVVLQEELFEQPSPEPQQAQLEPLPSVEEPLVPEPSPAAVEETSSPVTSRGRVKAFRPPLRRSSQGGPRRPASSADYY